MGLPVAQTLHSQCRAPSLIPGQGTRSHMPKLRVHMTQLKILHVARKKEDLDAATKIQCSQINIINKNLCFLNFWNCGLQTVGLYVCQRLYVCMPGADSEMEIQLQATGSDQIRSDQSLSRV